MIRSVFYLVFVVFCCQAPTAAARAGSISGRVLDDAGQPLPFASILLQHLPDSQLVKTELTDVRGEFLLTPVGDGNFSIRVMLLGYHTHSSASILVAGNAVELPGIFLSKNGIGLDEVAVTAQKPLLEVHAGKIVVNVENSITGAGASVLEVLARAPGVTVDPNDNVSLKGRQGVTIMIDGRVVPLSQTDLANMLRSMPSASVEKIELLTNPSSQYDAAGTAGVINIKTRKDKAAGFNGTANGSYGQGVYRKETGGVNLNFRQKNLNVYASYNASYREGFSHVDWTRRYFDGPAYTGAFVQDNYSVLDFNTNMGAVGADYTLNKKDAVGVALTGENFYLGTRGYYFANVMDKDDRLQSWFATRNTSSGEWNNLAPNVHWRHSFDSSGRELSIDADYARYWNHNTQDFMTRYYLPDGSEYQPAYRLHAHVAGLTQIRSVKGDYVQPLKGNAKLEAGVKSSYVTADNQPDFYDRSNGTDIWDSTKSDHFLYREQINAAYVNTGREWKKWSAQAGLRAEQSVISGLEKITGRTFDNSYIQLFPSLAVQRHINASHDLGLTLSRRIERPGYEDLNPYTFYVDPSTRKTGNPYLRPALTYATELSHTFRQQFITTLSYSVTTDVITDVIKPSTTQDRVTIQTKDNLATMRFIGISGAYNMVISKWWTNVTNYNAYYAAYEGNVSNTPLRAGKATFDVNTTNKFTLSHGWSAEIGCFYQAAQLYGYLDMRPLSMFSAGLQKTLLDKRLTLKLNANDLFWHGSQEASSVFTNYTEHFIARHDTRQVALAVVYRFGRKTVAPVSNHSGGAEEEKKRASDKGL